MNESLLTELFGVAEGDQLTRTEYEGDFLRLHLQVQSDPFCCPTGGTREIRRRGRRQRERQTVPIGLVPVSLQTEVPDGQGRAGGKRFELSPPWPRPIAGSPIDWWRSGKPSPQ